MILDLSKNIFLYSMSLTAFLVVLGDVLEVDFPLVVRVIVFAVWLGSGLLWLSTLLRRKDADANRRDSS